MPLGGDTIPQVKVEAVQKNSPVELVFIVPALPAEADEGIFFIPAGGGAATKIDIVQKNKPSQLVFLIPAAAPAGDYFLEVRARMSIGTELRTGHLDATLTI